MFVIQKPMKKEGMSHQAYRLIKDMITKGKLHPGELINESQMQERLNLGRTPVREALLRLSREQLVTIHQRKGIEVVRISPKMIRDIFEIRLIMEPNILRKKFTALDRAPFLQIRDRLISIINMKSYTQDEVTESANIDFEFHTLINRSLGNQYVDSLNETFYNHLKMIFFSTTLQAQTNRPIVSNEEHLSIIDAILQDNVDLACERLTNHLQLSYKDTMENYLNSEL